MKLTKKLSTKQFFISQILLLSFGLIFLAGLYYILNIQYQKPKGPFLAGPITTAPKTLRLDLDQPEQDSLFYSPEVLVSGKTGPGSLVLISTENFDSVIKSKPDGSFSTVLSLDEGVNKITAATFDSTGDSRSAERTVYYSKEKL
ncbi:hypothetical protein HYU45_05020 [Candidatus Daviesbacteria bacterium]|nr:hypothetical protein [Candidatus Daviesbacteria bacterium]